MSGNIIPDEETNKIAEKKIENTKEGQKNKSSNIKKAFANMLIDFNIVPTIIGFAIAVSFAELMKETSHLIIQLYFKQFLKDDIVIKLFSFILVLILCYIFGYIIFYKLIFTEDIAKQTIIKKAINEKKEEEVKKEIEKDYSTTNAIQESAKINNYEGFSIF